MLGLVKVVPVKLVAQEGLPGRVDVIVWISDLASFARL